MYERVIIPSDGSELAGIGVEEGLLLAKKLRRPAIAVYVIDLSEYEKTSNKTVKKSAGREFKKAGESVLKEIRRKAHDMDVKIETKLLFGKPYKRITENANKNDVIVMSSHGISGFSELFLGSTTERVIKYSPCTVTVVKGK